MTSQDAVGEFAQFIYTALIRTATGNSGLQFKASMAPFPVSALINQNKATAGAFTLSFIFAICFALIPVTVVSYLINERKASLKHQQVVSGIMMPAYWMSNYIVDFIKLMILSLIAICFIYIYGVTIDYVWLALLLYPFAAIPYTYFWSFIF